MRVVSLASILALALVAQPAAARQTERPITDREVDAMDVATTPMTDLNLRRDEIPEVLVAAQTKPYDLTGLKKCPQLTAQINQLNQLLGPDLDLPQQEAQRITAGRVAQWVVGSFIPFRGIVREISGANDQQRQIQAAIEAGYARRGFLKGVGEARGCQYPARSATPAVVKAQSIALASNPEKDEERREEEAEERKKVANASAANAANTQFTSNPVVQEPR